MNQKTVRASLGLLIAFFTACVLPSQANNVSWTNTSGGNWSNTNNWSPNQLPGSNDTAVITTPGNYSVTLDVSPTVAGLDLGAINGVTTQSLSTGGQTLTINGPIQVFSQGQFNVNGGALAGTNVLTGTLTWSGGSLAGNMTVTTNSFLNIVTGGGDGFNGFVLTNNGTVTWTNTTLYGLNSNNAQIYNYGLWNAQSDSLFVGGNNGGTTLFANFGTFLKSGNTGITTLDGGVVFNNTGTVNVESGTLDIEGGGTGSGGNLTTSGTGNISFISTAYNFTNTNTFTGTGIFVGGGATFGGTIVGTLNWDGGFLSGVMTLPTNSVFNIVTGGGNGFNGLVFTNDGTVNWTNTTLYGREGNNAQIYNYGLWNAQSDNGFTGGNEGGTTLFENFGTFLKSGNTGATTLDGGVVFNNVSAVNVASGTLDIGRGTNNGGNFTTAGSASLNFDDTAYVFTNTTTFTGIGASVSSGAVFGGTILGTLTWDGGALSGVMTLATNSVFNIVTGGGDGFYGLVFTNYGTVNWTNTTLYGRNDTNAQIYNYGLWNAQSDNLFVGGNEGGTTLFENFGTFLKSGGSGLITLDTSIVFVNTGTINVEQGQLTIDGGGENGGGGGGGVTGGSTGGTLLVAGNSTLSFNNYAFSGTTTVSGGGIVSFGGNSTSMNGALIYTNLELVSGTFSGTNSLTGMLTWSGGSMAGVTTVTSNSVLNIVTGGGNGFYGLALTNYGTVTWTNTTLYGRNGQNAQIYNYGLWIAQSDNFFVGGNEGGTTLFDNFGTFIKSGNTGATTLDGGVVFNNTGTVNVESGTLDIEGGGTGSGGNLTTSGTGNISFISTAYNFTNTNTFTGTGIFVGGGATFGGTIVGTLNWDGGFLSGVMTLPTNSVFNIVTGGGNGFNGLVFTNDGTVNWTNTTLYGREGNNAQIYNYGLWNAQSDNGFTGGNEGGTTLFENFGTFLKSGNTGATTLDGGVVFNNVSAVNVASGTLDIGRGTNNGGNFTTAGSASLNFDDTAYVFTNTTTFTGIGASVSSGAVFGGTILGTLTWDGGALSGVMTLATNSVFNIVTGGGDGFYGLVFTNYGTVTWTNTTLYGRNVQNAQIYNYGLWIAQSDSGFTGGNEGGTTLFDNFGTFRKTGNAGATTLDSDVVFNNTGILDAQSGTLSLSTYTLTGGTLNFGISSLTNFGQMDLVGNPALTGTLSANLNNNYVPAVSNAFQVLDFTSSSGAFTHTNLPAAAVWQTTYNPANVTISVLQLAPVLSCQFVPGSTNIVISWTTNSANYLLKQTHSLLPPIAWSPVTNNIVISGTNNTVTILGTNGAKFFELIGP